ncbi:MAG: hypothetical protein ACYDAL_13245 [Candidatus Dormibacteraceae bacterium]
MVAASAAVIGGKTNAAKTAAAIARASIRPETTLRGWSFDSRLVADSRLPFSDIGWLPLQ